MRRLFIAAIAAAALSSPVLAHTAAPVPQGWSVQPIDNRRAHVVYTGVGDLNRIRDTALLGAAEMTLEQRATWFRIDTEWVEGAGPGGQPTTVALAVKFGEGPTPQEANAFDATEVAQALRTRLADAR